MCAVSGSVTRRPASSDVRIMSAVCERATELSAARRRRVRVAKPILELFVEVGHDGR